MSLKKHWTHCRKNFAAESRMSPFWSQQRRLLLGIFQGVPATKKSVFDLSIGPAHIVLYQRNIESVCASEIEVRHQIRQTLIHAATERCLGTLMELAGGCEAYPARGANGVGGRRRWSLRRAFSLADGKLGALSRVSHDSRDGQQCCPTFNIQFRRSFRARSCDT
jgi:hypothetical protein